MNQIRLSICIATFNRARFIGATLESIISQATEEVEIVIVDGASADDTEQVVGKYTQRFPRLRYFRQDSNMGVDRDFARSVELAIGEYCWLMSDDDLLKPGAIRPVLKEASRNYGLIIVNSEVRNTDLSEVIEENRLHRTDNRIYKPGEGQIFFSEVANYLSFIGCVVIKRDLWNAREKERFFGTAFIHVGVIFQTPLSEDIMVIADPLITIRYGNALWSARGFEIWMFQWPDLIWSFPDYSEWAKRRVCPREPWRSLKELLVCRAKGIFSIKEYRRLLEPRTVSRWSRFLSLLIAVIPGCLANLFGVIYFSIFYNDPRFPIEDLANSRFYFLSYFRDKRIAKGHG